MHIAGEVAEAAKGVIIIINKGDLAQEQRRAEREEDVIPHPDDEIETAEHYRKIVQEEFKFMPYAPVVFASAKTGYHVQSILEAVVHIAEMRFLRVPTSRLNEVVHDAVLNRSRFTMRRKRVSIPRRSPSSSTMWRPCTSPTNATSKTACERHLILEERVLDCCSDRAPQRTRDNCI